jgi:hypothetical protein
MGIDWNFAAVIVAVLAVSVALAVGGITKTVKRTVQWIRLRNPAYSKCDTLLWENMPEPFPERSSYSALHSCRFAQLCGDHGHKSGVRCWESTMSTLFNNHWPLTRRSLAVPKPDTFIENDLEKSYLLTDYFFIMAFIFCTMRKDCGDWAILERPIDFLFGSVRIQVNRELSTPLFTVLHLEGTFQRSLTKKEVERLIMGYPPFYREKLQIRPGGSITVRPIRSEEDVPRGGWVIAAGFSNTKPVPVYMDVRKHGKRTRAGVFWKSFERVKAILQGPISQAFPDNDDVQRILAGVTFMLEKETDSGGHSFLSESSISGLDLSTLSQDQYVTAIKIFNQPPRLSSTDLEKLREELAPILGVTLKAAFLGVHNCFVYMKNAGRELNVMLPEGLHSTSKVYLQGCE